MIIESMILLGIKNLEHRRSRIPMIIIHADFIDFVKEENGVVNADFTETLDDKTREGSDVGSSVPSDFCFVAHAAEGNAVEFPAEGGCDGFCETCFSGAWRTDEEENWCVIAFFLNC
jgi:hypothetical protein